MVLPSKMQISFNVMQESKKKKEAVNAGLNELLWSDFVFCFSCTKLVYILGKNIFLFL